MSATLDAQPLLNYWPNSALIYSEGRQFPVQEIYSQTPITLAGGPALTERVLKSVLAAAEDGAKIGAGSGLGGHILVFLPGQGEIRRLQDLAQNQPRLSQFRICALHGQMTLEEQMDVLTPTDQRKIIFSTNIAETSLTVDGVVTVIDSGLVRMTSFDRRTGVESLDLVRASRSSQKQRQGRAGRQQAGRCFKLFSKSDDLSTSDQTKPEIRRADLADAILLLAAWGVRDPQSFDWFEAPQADDLEERISFLKMLKLISPSGALTELGTRIHAWPVSARLACLIDQSARTGNAQLGVDVVAVLSERDFVRNDANLDSFAGEDSDLTARLQLLEARGSDGRSVHGSAVQMARQVRDSFLRFTQAINVQGPEAFTHALLLCFPDRICRRRGESRKAKMVGGRGIELDPRSLCAHADYFLALQLRATRGGKRI